MSQRWNVLVTEAARDLRRLNGAMLVFLLFARAAGWLAMEKAFKQRPDSPYLSRGAFNGFFPKRSFQFRGISSLICRAGWRLTL